ncbi:hypothetical protein [Yinghuangia soli]|uniref:Uncharacterized protein n=1 Tax=Yinghuangia soli TaxID=2908204 RepID=A0AA41PUE4_9ACTN|nr:hypothetical protein [Yinghuangia soli]MCF2525918.1 hypothetical protein [Yinghuangia soli]
MARTEVRRLTPISGFPFPVRASSGTEARAEELAARTERVLAWTTDALHFVPTLRLNVADAEDWSGITDMPLYGMPRTVDGEVAVAPGDAPFFAEQLASYEPHISTATRANLREEFGEPGSLLPYYEAIHVHELMHLYHQQDWASYPDLWLVELHANMGMIGYLSEMEPDMLPAVHALTSVVYDMPAESMWFRRLPDMEQALENGLFNFAWYFFHLTLAAEELWETGGTPLFRRLYEYVRARQHAAEPGPVTRDEMWAVHPALAQMMDEWPSGVGPGGGGPVPSEGPTEPTD